MSDGAIYLPWTVYHVPCIMDLPVLFVCSYLPSSVLTMYPVACCHRPVVPFYPVSVVDAKSTYFYRLCGRKW